MINWLMKNRKFVKIRAIEQELGMPDSTLIKHVNGSQKMADKWAEPLNSFLNGFVKNQGGKKKK
jgi:hypothetical protein